MISPNKNNIEFINFQDKKVKNTNDTQEYMCTKYNQKEYTVEVKVEYTIFGTENSCIKA